MEPVGQALLFRVAAKVERSDCQSRDASNLQLIDSVTLPMSGAHLCFYSTRCRYSQAFLEELSRTPYAREFRFVCVDTPAGGPRPALPPYVRAVPTLMIAGEHEPRVDGAVMNWLSERRLRDRTDAMPSLVMSGPGSARPPVGGGPATMTMAAPAAPAASSSSGVPTGGGPMTDMTGERGGGGLAGFFGAGDFAVGGDEHYAFIGDNTTPSEKSMVRMAGNMAGLGDYGTLSMSESRMAAGGGIASFAGVSGGAAAMDSMSGSSSAKSAKAKAMDDALAAFQASRDRDIPGPIARR